MGGKHENYYLNTKLKKRVINSINRVVKSIKCVNINNQISEQKRNLKKKMMKMIGLSLKNHRRRLQISRNQRNNSRDESFPNRQSGMDRRHRRRFRRPVVSELPQPRSNRLHSSSRRLCFSRSKLRIPPQLLVYALDVHRPLNSSRNSLSNSKLLNISIRTILSEYVF